MQTTMKRILFVTTGLAYGGAETQLKHLAIRLKHRGWEVAVASMLPPAAYLDELEAAGICVYNLRMRRKVPDPRALFRLAAIIRREHPTVVHAHMVHANLLTRLTRLIASMPLLICTVHSIIEGGRWREIAYRLTDPLANLTTQVSQAGLERYVQVGAVPKHKIWYIPNGIDTVRFRPDRGVRASVRQSLGIRDEFVWLAVGRLEPVKDYPAMLTAFKQVTGLNDDALLLIAGQGSFQDEIERLIALYALDTKVRLLGIRRDIPQLLNAADAFVMSSLWEGMPLVLLEATACARPIVATDVGGNREVVLHGETGYLVPPRNPDALADAMLRLMNLPEPERLAMGQAGRQHIVENFDIERIVDRWEQLYLELLERKNLLQRDRA